MLELKLLGSPQILLDGQPVSGLAAAKSQALLFYLAVNGRPQSRLALAGLLWPDKRETDALSNLRQSLYHLRNALPDYLAINRLTVAFNATLPCQIDAILFEKEIDASNDLATRQTAVNRYNGEFLAGFYVDEAEPFEAWAVVIRERLHRLATEALHDLVADLGARQEITLGLRYVNQWLAVEPWQEEAHRHKIQFLAWDGQMQAALAHYERCRQLLAEELGSAPAAKTVALIEQIRRGEIEGKTRRQEDKKSEDKKSEDKKSEDKKSEDKKSEDKKIEAPGLSIQNLKPVLAGSESVRLSAHAEVQNQHDWGEMPDVRTFWGRDAEMAQIEQWLVTEQQRVVIILGMGGMGKTTLAAALAPRLAPHFDWVLWRSLLNAPPLSDILRDWVQTLSGYTLTTWPTLLDAQLTLLFTQLRQQRCLLVLDNVESILSPADEQQGGAYPPEYADYGQFFARLGDSVHQSALLLTSRELPPELARLERKGAPMRRLPLPGLPFAAGQRLLADDGLIGAVEQQQELLNRYSGNPLALQLVSKTIQDFFAGEIAAFLSDETLFFDDVREVLDQQFARLTGLERELLLWLAIEREPVPLPLLQQQLLYTGPKSAVIEALLDLQQRTLLEKTPTGFTLQNVIMEYATAYLVDAVGQEIETATPHLLHSHALLKAQAKEYLRQSQARLLLQPISERLQKKLGGAGLVAQLKRVLAQVRQDATGRATYAGGNILNLLVHCQAEGQADLQQADFANLAVWQAYLPGAELVGVNFTGSDLTNSVFAEQFGVMVSLAFSPDGQTLAAGAANDNKIRFWQVKSGQPLGMLVGHSGMVAELAFSPDGKHLASSSYDQTICLWDLQTLGTAAFYTQRPLQTLRGHEAGVWCVVFSPDGQRLASGGKDQSVLLWDVEKSSGRTELRHSLHGHTGGLNAMTFSPDGQLLATGGLDCTVRVWHVASGQVLAQFNGHTGRIWRLAFSPDGRLLASGDWDHQIRLWDLADLPLPGAAEPLLSEEARLLTGHDGHITQLRFSADGRMLVSCGDDRTLRLWDVAQAGAEVARYALQDHPGRDWSMDITPDGELLAGAGGDLSIRLWNVRNGQLLRRLQGHAQDVITVAFDPTGMLLAASCQDHKVRLWDMQTQRLRSVLRGHTDGVEDVVFCAPRQGQKPLLASSSVDQTIRLWDAHSGQLLQTLRGHTSWIRTIAVSPDGRWLASASNDETVRLWSTLTGELLQTWSAPAEGSWCWAVAFSPNGKTLAVGCRLDVIYLWDIDSPNPPPNPITLRGHSYSITTLAFSPDGDLLASGSFDQTVRLWRVQTGECVAVLQGHEAWVWRVAFSPDGATLASASEDQMLCLWDVSSGQRRHRLHGHSAGVRGVTFSPDGKTVVSGSSDGTIKGWDSESGAGLFTLAAPRPYEGMNINGATGLTEAQKMALKTLGALEDALAERADAAPIQPGAATAVVRTVASVQPAAPALPSIPFVARSQELARLEAALAQMLGGRGQIHFITGEAGSGKTALTRTFAERAQAIHPALVVVDSLCSAQTGIADPYLPFRQLLNQLINLTAAPDAPAEQQRGGRVAGSLENELLLLVVAALVEFGPDLIESFVSGAVLLQGMQRLNGQAGAGRERLRTQIEQLQVRGANGTLAQNRIFTQYTAVLQQVAAQRPLLLILDDLHWADASSLSFLFHLARNLAQSRVLLLGAYRPEDLVEDEMDKAHPLQAILGELKRTFGDVTIDLEQAMTTSGRSFIDGLLDSEPNQLGESFRRALLAHTEGHPLFTVELLRDLRERRALQRDAAGRWVAAPTLDWRTLPVRVEGVIETRIGRLPQTLLELLQIASIEGEMFTAEVVARVLGSNERQVVRLLGNDLARRHRLVSADGISIVGGQRLARYRFRHNLFQHYLYHSQTASERLYLHGEVAKALEALYVAEAAGEPTHSADAARVDTAALARHYQAAGMVEKALIYLRLAGNRARQLSAHQEAITHLRQALTLLAQLPASRQRDEQELEMQIALGAVLVAVEGFGAVTVEAAYQRALALCHQLDAATHLWPVLHGLWNVHEVRAELAQARAFGDELLRLTVATPEAELGLAELGLVAHRDMGATLHHQGEIAASRHYLELGLPFLAATQAQAVALRYSAGPGVGILVYLAADLWLLGYAEQAVQRSQAALALAQEMKHPFSLALALNFAAGLHHFRRDPLQVQAVMTQMQMLLAEHSFPVWAAAAQGFSGWVLVQRGEIRRGLAQMEQGLTAWRAAGQQLSQTFYLGLIAEGYLAAGESQAGLALIDEALALVATLGERYWEAELYRLQGELWWLQPAATDQAAACFEQAIGVARRQQARALELRATTTLCRLWQSQGKSAAAQERLSAIYDWFTEGFASVDLQKAQQLLTALRDAGADDEKQAIPQ